MIKTIAESTAAQKDELLLALFESSLYGIMLLRNVYNEQGIIEDFEFRAINSFAEGILGKTVPEGSKFNEVFEQAKEAGIFQTYVEVATQKTTTLSFESHYPIHSDMMDGRWFKQKVAAHKDGIVVTFEDITSQRNVEHLLLETKEHAAETENKYLALVNSMQQGFCIIEMLFDENGRAYDYRFIEANPAFTKHTGLSSDVIGRTIKEFVPGHEQYWFDIYGDVVLTRKALHFEQEAMIINGWYEVYAIPVDEAPNRVAVFFSDITVRKKAERKAEQERRNAMQALKSKQMFLSNMSHEIRTPLTAVIGFTEEILKTPLDERQKEYIHAIKISGDAMLVLVNDILDLAKVDEGKMEFNEHPFQLDACIRNMLLLFETKLDQKNLSLIKNYDTNIPSILLGDSTRLNQIIMNLVSNAVKFTQEGEITISAKVLEQDRNHITIQLSVADTGIGIKAEDVEKIFESYKQSRSDTSKVYEGTGLGLSIVKQLVEAQGGEVTVESELGKGSTFTVTLPFKKPRPDQKMEKREEQDNQQHALKSDKEYRILVAEDVKLNQLLMQVVLANMGFKADIVPNGSEAVELIKQNAYDLVLMDIQMPVMDGYEAAKHIREVLNIRTPILALTADVTTADIHKIKECGMDDYATKPIKQENLFRKIMEVLDK